MKQMKDRASDNKQLNANLCAQVMLDEFLS